MGTVVGVFVQYLVLERLLSDRIEVDNRTSGRRYGAMFGSQFIGGLGIILGCLLLVIPGLILLAGWSTSSSMVVAERQSSVEALKESWRATSGSRLTLTLVYGVGIVIAIALFAVSIGASNFLPKLGGVYGEDQQGLPAIIVLNVCTSAISMANYTLGAAVYRLVRPTTAGLDQVFD